VLNDIAQVGAGLLQLQPTTVDVAEIVGHALADCRAAIDARKLCARFDADTTVPPLVTGDPFRLLQAVTTLIDHAAQSTAEGGEIDVTVQVAGGDVVVRVVDTGRGIAPDVLPRMFETAEGAVPGGGMSLGLTLVRRLIELQDGAIRAASDGIGKGATFEIRLPLAPQDVELSSLVPFPPADSEQSVRERFADPTVRIPAMRD
jgi:signal transduction histidine kinase